MFVVHCLQHCQLSLQRRRWRGRVQGQDGQQLHCWHPCSAHRLIVIRFLLLYISCQQLSLLPPLLSPFCSPHFLIDIEILAHLGLEQGKQVQQKKGGRGMMALEKSVQSWFECFQSIWSCLWRASKQEMSSLLTLSLSYHFEWFPPQPDSGDLSSRPESVGEREKGLNTPPVQLSGGVSKA